MKNLFIELGFKGIFNPYMESGIKNGPNETILRNNFEIQGLVVCTYVISLRCEVLSDGRASPNIPKNGVMLIRGVTNDPRLREWLYYY